MTNINPWADMSASSQRRIEFKTPHNLFWVKDYSGKYGFQLQSESSAPIDENTIQLRGISIIKRLNNKNNIELFLILNKQEEWEVFQALCEDLVSLTRKYNSDIAMITAVENRLKRWQQLLKLDTNRKLTIEMQMGLFSELICLKDIIINEVGVRQAITSWVGPEFDKQDFLLDEIVIEVKSHRTSKREFAHISSKNQLDSEKGPLYLFSYALTSSDNGLSIEDMSNKIRDLIINEPIETASLFENKLLEYGYIPEINKEPLQKFIVDKLKIFCVTDEFPKISTNAISNKIVEVKYVIDLRQCCEFEVELVSLFNGDDKND